MLQGDDNLIGDKWFFFENDICEGCNAGKAAKLMGIREGSLRVIVSCNCDDNIYGPDVQKSIENGEVFVVLDPDGVNNMIKMIAQMLSEKKE